METDERTKRLAKALWVAMGGSPDLFEREWEKDSAMRENWTAYVDAVIAEYHAASDPGEGDERHGDCS